jgi:hypothetical protein
MTTVYAVLTGCYSDKGFPAIFSKHHLAQAYCDEYNKGSYGDARIEDYELDAAKDYRKVPYFRSCIMYDVGELCDRETGYHEVGETYCTGKDMTYQRGRRLITTVDRIPYYSAETTREPSYITVFSSESADHADKLAIEARQEFQRLVGQGMSYADIDELWRGK